MRASEGRRTGTDVERRIVRVAAALLLAACGDAGVAPAGGTPPPRQGPRIVPVTLRISPASATMQPGETLRLEVAALDSRGTPVVPAAAFAYESEAPAVATVNGAGVVTAVAPGSAVVFASAPVAGWSRSTAMLVVVPGRDGDEVRLMRGALGWQPAVANLPVGGTVRWSITGGSSSRADPAMLYLMSAENRIVDSLELRGETATRRFETVGTTRYCSGLCGEPTDFGVIHVR